MILVHDCIHALQPIEELSYSEFKTLVAGGKIAEVSVGSQTLTESERSWARAELKAIKDIDTE